MPAPLVAAATYFGLPRLLGSLADKVAQSRYEDLIDRGVNPQADTLLHALNLVPRQSGVEDLIDYARMLYNGNPYGMRGEDIPTGDVSTPDARTIDDLLAGRGFNDPNVQPGVYVDRELPYDQGVVSNTPMEDFLKYGGRDDDSGMSSMDLLRQDFDRNQSYGQTNQPATEVRFDAPLVNPETGEEYKLSDQTVVVEAPRQQQGGGFAGGGLADILRMMYAQRQR